MIKLHHRISSVILILGFLMSMGGIGVAKHYCGGKLTQTALLGDAACCCEIQTIAENSCCSEPVVEESCCASESEGTDDERSCCNTEFKMIKMDLEARQASLHQIEIQPLVYHAASSFDVGSNISPASETTWLQCIEGPAPPYQGRFSGIVLQSFLL